MFAAPSGGFGDGEDLACQHVHRTVGVDLEFRRQARGATKREACGAVPETTYAGLDIAFQAAGRDQHQGEGAGAEEAGA